jgi:hypothetical protein
MHSQIVEAVAAGNAALASKLWITDLSYGVRTLSKREHARRGAQADWLTLRSRQMAKFSSRRIALASRLSLFKSSASRSRIQGWDGHPTSW